MTDAQEAGMLLRYGRAGGREPRDDEALEIAPDGSWAARRTVAGRRVGRFAGRLPEAELAALAGEVAAATTAGDAEVPTPRDGATETLAVDGAELIMGSNEDAPVAWRPLVRRVRTLLVERVPDEPVAALELDAGPTTARLVAVGTEPFEVDPGSITVQVVLLGPDGVRRDRWGAGSGDPGRWTSADPGWTLDLPFGHGLAPAADEVLQVRVGVRVRDGRTRTTRLFLAIPARGAAAPRA